MFAKLKKFDVSEISQNDLDIVFEDIVLTCKESNLNINEDKLELCESVADELIRKNIFTKAIELYTILI